MPTPRRYAHTGSGRLRAGVWCLPLSAALLCLSLLPPPSQTRAFAQDDDDVVRVTTDLVVLNVTVKNGSGAYVHGLKRKDFKILEDKREQTIMSFGEEQTPFAAALLLDVSGSMEGRVSLARSAGIRFLEGLREDDNAAVYSFHSKVEQVQEFSPSRDLAPNAFGLEADGMTVLHDAVLRAAQDLSTRPEKRRAIIVVSDGADTSSKAGPGKALDGALSANATIYTVDMADRPKGSANGITGAGVLRDFAQKSGGQYVSTPGGKELRDAFAQIVEELSNQYTIAFVPTDRKRDGRWRELEVTLSHPALKARTRRGYRLQAKSPTK
ncbi:MAG: VWA domain-containing protein [Pyrinomonadaceae bacterium]